MIHDSAPAIFPQLIIQARSINISYSQLSLKILNLFIFTTSTERRYAEDIQFVVVDGCKIETESLLGIDHVPLIM